MLTVESRDGRAVGIWGIGKHRSRWWTGVLERGVGPIRGGPGKLGHSRILRARAQLLELTLQLQIEGVSSGVVLRQEWLECRRSMGCCHRHTQAGLRVWCGWIEHEVLVYTVVAVVVVLIGSQGLWMRGRGKPCLRLIIRGERRKVDRGKVVGGRTRATRCDAEVQRSWDRRL